MRTGGSRRLSFSAVRHCTCLNLRQAARAVTQFYDDHLRPTGLRTTQFSLLVMIHEAGPVSITQLAHWAVMDRTTLKRNLELLRRDGLVRIGTGADARVREVELTRAAREKLAAALPYWGEAQARITAKLGKVRGERLLTDLSAAVAAAQGEASKPTG
jgi:DNA-binding MarR family transcriptional regulator